ncbi:hypothetical protein TNCV_2575331 [Trichonephila clavipes]|uniref:Uncharacterized protein n=1 Tax=Trichonephila clavipes TaxID=2585209 RepID=A0A8X6R5K8_TRICX|nr:hypothetical protein TNCV_2575331 [Trichonephila clavipes]
MLWKSHKLRNGLTDSKVTAWTSKESDQRSGRSQTSRNAAVVGKRENIIKKDCRLTAREIAEQVENSTGSARVILCDNLSMRRGAAKFVLKFLSVEQKLVER